MSQIGTVHIVGAGLAGLSAAVQLCAAGQKVVLYEAGTHAGGRCRSYIDKELNARIDNGNHLMLSCNHAVLGYVHTIGAQKTLNVAKEALFPFYNLDSGESWSVHINQGRIPWWIADKNRRVPGTIWRDYINLLRPVFAGRWQTVAQALHADKASFPVYSDNILYKRLIQPLCVAIMNTQGDEASAKTFGNVLGEIFQAGGAGAKPMLVKEGLSESLVDPALAFIQSRGGQVQFGQRLRTIGIENNEARKLVFAGQEVVLDKWDWVVLALPAWVINDIIPGMATPNEYRSIVNAHFKVGSYKPRATFTGLINGVVEWVFEKGDILSTTTSAAERYVDKSAEELAPLLWRDVARLYGLDPTAIPPHRIVKEKRATFAATPDQIARRPSIKPRHANLILCGDWTDTKLPSTIEGAIRSGAVAASRIIPPAGF